MYSLTIKANDGKTVVFGNNRCIYDYESLEDLMVHIKEIDESGMMRKYGWRLIISQQS